MLNQRIKTFSKLLTNSTKDIWLRNVHNASDRLEVYGANGSPYTKKVKSALRYKQIPFNYYHLMPGNFMGDWEKRGFGHIKAKVGLKKVKINCNPTLHREDPLQTFILVSQKNLEYVS